MMTATYAALPLETITASTTNPRRHFDQAKLAELAESIRASGVHQPILVRPLPGERVPDTGRAVQYEIVSGERRFRASELAGAATIPAICRELTDDQVLEIQLVENLQRSDLSEQEEAEGYDRLMQHSGLTADLVAEKIGKSRSYVYGRLKLLDLCQEARQALGDGTLDASRALLIARIPDHKLQLHALEFSQRKDYAGNVVSVRGLQDWLQKEVMLRLDRAPFDVKAEGLLSAVPACMACPKRTGANPDLFADVQSADVCTDPGCFGKKKAAHNEAQAKAAAERGQTVIMGDEAAALLPYDGARIEGYQRLDAKDYIGGKTTTLRKVLGKDNLPKPTLVLNPHTNEIEEVIPDTVVKKLLAKVQGKSGKTLTSRAAQVEAHQLEEQFKDRWHETAVKRLFAEVSNGKLQVMSVAFARLLAVQVVETCYLDAMGRRLIEQQLGSGVIGVKDGVAAYVNSCPDDQVATVLLLLMVLSDLSYGDNDTQERAMRLLAKEVGTDVDAIKEEIRAEMFPTPGPAEEDDPPPAPAAPSAKGAKKPRGKASTKPVKTSADEAQASIAAAMQQADAEGSALPFTVGQSVRFRQDIKTSGGKLRKVSGREGTIEASVGDRAFSVRFGEKAHETAVADYTELEAIDG